MRLLPPRPSSSPPPLDPGNTCAWSSGVGDGSLLLEAIRETPNRGRLLGAIAAAEAHAAPASGRPPSAELEQPTDFGGSFALDGGWTVLSCTSLVLPCSRARWWAFIWKTPLILASVAVATGFLLLLLLLLLVQRVTICSSATSVTRQDDDTLAGTSTNRRNGLGTDRTDPWVVAWRSSASHGALLASVATWQTTHIHIRARVSATFIRRTSAKNPTEDTPPPPTAIAADGLARTALKMTTSASRPWYPSTVAKTTRSAKSSSRRPAWERMAERRAANWARYGVSMAIRGR